MEGTIVSFGEGMLLAECVGVREGNQDHEDDATRSFLEILDQWEKCRYLHTFIKNIRS